MTPDARNFLIDATATSEHQPSVQLGTESGFTMTIYQRLRGELVDMLNVEGYVDLDGKLRLTVEINHGHAAADVRADVEITTAR